MTHQDPLYFRQLLSGHDYARDDGLAQQMRNLTYLVGDQVSREVLVVDPAYAPEELLAIIEQDQMNLAGVLVTHYHPDHIGGSMMGFRLEGLAQLLEKKPVPVHVQATESHWVSQVTGIAVSELTTHHHGDTLRVGDVCVECLHTPGHTPGSQCFLVSDRLIAGDTLFLDGCGRTDLPGGDADALYESLSSLARLRGNPLVCPGHWYSARSCASLDEVRHSNHVYRVSSLAQWHAMMGFPS